MKSWKSNIVEKLNKNQLKVKFKELKYLILKVFNF